MSEEMILVTGATGKTGRRVVRLLEERDLAVRAASRSGTPSFDWSDRGTWEPVLRGVTKMYLVLPDLGSPQAAEDVAAFARQAAAAGARHAVLLSTPSDAWGPAQEHVLATERALEHAGLEWTVLRVRWFFQNFSEDFLYDPVLSGEVRLPAGDGKEAFVDAEDIAEAAVAALTEDGHAGWCYEVSGPRLMSFQDTIEEIARATGRDIRYVSADPGGVRGGAARAGCARGVGAAVDRPVRARTLRRPRHTRRRRQARVGTACPGLLRLRQGRCRAGRLECLTPPDWQVPRARAVTARRVEAGCEARVEAVLRVRERRLHVFLAAVARTPYILMSPVTGQPGPITLSAWGHQLTVDAASDPRVEQLLTAYVQGSQTPEPGAPCTGGPSSP
jgi:uncharacterized protein YbjT (DUF2867 family)